MTDNNSESANNSNNSNNNNNNNNNNNSNSNNNNSDNNNNNDNNSNSNTINDNITVKTETQPQPQQTQNIKLKGVDLTTFKGPRYSKLCMVFEKALTKSIDTFSLNKLKKSFPLLAKYDEKGLTKAHTQVTEFLKRESQVEYNKIITNRELIRKLNELDFPENGKKINIENILKCDPNQLLLNICYKEKKRVLEETREELEQIKRQNAVKMQKLHQLNEETFKISSKIRGIGKDFIEAFEVAEETKEKIEENQ